MPCGLGDAVLVGEADAAASAGNPGASRRIGAHATQIRKGVTGAGDHKNRLVVAAEPPLGSDIVGSTGGVEHAVIGAECQPRGKGFECEHGLVTRWNAPDLKRRSTHKQIALFGDRKVGEGARLGRKGGEGGDGFGFKIDAENASVLPVCKVEGIAMATQPAYDDILRKGQPKFGNGRVGG